MTAVALHPMAEALRHALTPRDLDLLERLVDGFMPAPASASPPIDPHHDARVFFVALMAAHDWRLVRAARAIRVSSTLLRKRLLEYAPEDFAMARALGLVTQASDLVRRRA